MTTLLKNALIVNHQVVRTNANGTDARSEADLSLWFDYVGRIGEFERRDAEHVNATTRADALLNAKAQFAGDLRGYLNYGARTGRHARTHTERPLVTGEKSGGTWWGAQGSMDKEKTIAAILDHDTNVIKSVVCVSRDWAARVHMQTKEDFQALLRGSWATYIEGLGVIPRADIRWCAEFHTDGEKSVHVHVLTWSAKENFCGDTLLARESLSAKNRRALADVVFKDMRFTNSLEKDFLRNNILLCVKEALGKPITQAEMIRIEQKAQAGGFKIIHLHPQNDTYLDGLYERIWENADVRGIGKVKYANATDEARKCALAALDHLKKNDELAGMFKRYEELVTEQADINGLTDGDTIQHRPRSTFIAKQTDDMYKRAENIILKHAASMDNPWERDDYLKLLRVTLTYGIFHSIDEKEIRTCAYASMKRGFIKDAEISKSIYDKLSEPEIRAQISPYYEAVLNYVQIRNARNLTVEQKERIYTRIIGYIQKSLLYEYKHSVKEIIASKTLNNTGYFTYRALSSSKVDAMFTEQEQGRLQTAFKEAIRARKAGLTQEYAQVKTEITNTLMSSPEVKNNIKLSCQLNKLAKQETKIFKQQVRERIENNIDREVNTYIKREEEVKMQAKENALSSAYSVAVSLTSLVNHVTTSSFVINKSHKGQKISLRQKYNHKNLRHLKTKYLASEIP